MGKFFELMRGDFEKISMASLSPKRGEWLTGIKFRIGEVSTLDLAICTGHPQMKNFYRESLK